MKRINVLSAVGATFALGAVLISCSKEVASKPNFIFKPSPDQVSVAKFEGKTLSHKDIFKGSENEIYELEKKIYDFKMAKIKAYLIERMIEADPKSKGMKNDEFLKRHISKATNVSQKEIEAFIKERKIPAQHINDQMKQRISQFLMMEKEKKAVEAWFNEKTAKTPIEIYLAQPKRPVFDVKVGEAPILGSKSAKVTIVEFSDFQCPFCSKGAEVMNQVKKKYGNKVKVAFKNFPLPFHTDAKGAAIAALCAEEQTQGKFWKMHDLMFKDQKNLKTDGLKAKAKSLGLDMKKFEDCIGSNKYTSKVDAYIEQGKKLGVKSTPTFFVNGIMVNGALPLDQFSEIIDQELGM